MHQKTKAIISEEVHKVHLLLQRTRKYLRKCMQELPESTSYYSRYMFLIKESFSYTNTFLTRCVIVQKRNIIANPLHKADRVFTLTATFEVSFPAKRVAILPIIRKRGAPGGWPNLKLKGCQNDSPHPRLTVGSRVTGRLCRKYKQKPSK